MAIDTYVVILPMGGGNALTSDGGVSFANPANVDFFPTNPALLSGNCFLPVSEWSDGVTQTLNITTTGSGAGKISFDPLSFTRAVDSLSSTLFVNCAKGVEYAYVDVLIQKAGTGVTYLGYRFGTAALSAMDWSSGEETPSEEIKLLSGQLTIGYAAPGGTPVFRGWDRLRNVGI